MTTRSRFLNGSLTAGINLLALLLAPLTAIAATAPAGGTTAASPFTEAKVNEIVGDVTIIPNSNPNSKVPAKVQDIFKAPDTLMTGRRSRAELKAEDGTIARVGSQTAFSLEANSRTVHLQQGSILFNSPKGMGGGTIVTNAATATVLGTTIIVTATSNGGFKILVLEGHASVTYPGGQTVNLGPGQMTFVLPGTTGGASGGGNSGGGSTGGTPGPVLNFDLDRETSNANLLTGFSITLPSESLILDASRGQQVLIKNGELVITDKAIVGAISSTQVVLVDQSTMTAAIDAMRNNNTDTGGDRLTRALASTLNLNDELSIPDLNVFTDPTVVSNILLNIPSGLLSNNALTVSGLIAGDIVLGGNVDLSSLNLPQLSLLAGNQNTFTFTGNTFIGVPSGTSNLTLYSAGSFVIPDGTVIEAGYQHNHDGIVPQQESSPLYFKMASVGALNLMNGSSIINDNGSLEIDTLTGDINLMDSGLRAIAYQANTTVSSRFGNISIVDSFLNVNYRATLSLKAGGNLLVNDSSLMYGDGGDFRYASLQAVGNTTLSNSYLSANRTLTLYGGPTVTLDSNTLSDASATYNIAANTVVVKNQNFSSESSLTFYSATGHVNLLGENDTPIAGDINFLGNVTLDGDDIGDSFNTGITADNAAVKNALTQTLTLPAEGISDDLFFNQVLFTPANLAQLFTTDHVYDGYFFSNGHGDSIIVGTLNISGNAGIDGVNQAFVRNVNITGSTNLAIFDESDFLLVLAGNLTTTPGATVNISFPESEGPGSFEIDSLPAFKLSNINLNVDAYLDIYGYADFDPAISIESSNVTSTRDLYFESVGQGSVKIANSTLTGDLDHSFEIISDHSGAISISNSTLTGGYVELATGDSENFQSGDIKIANSVINASGDEEEYGLDIYANDLIVSNSTLHSAEYIYIDNDGGVKIENSILAADNDYVDMYGYGFGITVSNSSITSDNGMDWEAYAGNLSISNSSLTDMDGEDIDLYAYGLNGGIAILSSNITTDGAIYIDGSDTTGGDSLGGSVLIQGSHLNANDSYLDIYAANNLNIINSTIVSVDELYLQADNGNILVQNSTLHSTDDDVYVYTSEDGSINVINSTLTADGNYLELQAADGDILIQGSNLTTNDSSVYVYANNVAISNSTLKATDDTVDIEAASALTLQNSTLNSNDGSGYIYMIGGDVVTVINSTLVATDVQIVTNNVENATININGAALDTAMSVSISSRTVNLSNINFANGSAVSLNSSNGLLAPNPNTGAVPVVGYVNYVTNVKYNNQPAQNFTYVPNSPGSSGSSSNPSAPIQIGTFHND